MIESIIVNNFRCFENLEINNLRKINVIVGKNSSGKTALLESIFMASGNSPEIALRIDTLRGLGSKLQVKSERTEYESLWKGLFYGFDQNKDINIKLIGSPAYSRSVTIGYNRGGTLTLPITEFDIDSPIIIPIVFEWRGQGDSVSFRGEVNVTEKGLGIPVGGQSLPVSFYSSSTQTNPAEGANRYSELSKKGREGTLVEVLKKEFPYINDISIQTRAGTAMLYASMNDIPEKIPIGLVSSGINKLVGIMLGIASTTQGVVLIDEIENGFYYDRLPMIWSALLRLCRENNTQLFASTHSHECLKALLPAIQQNEDDFLLIRAHKDNGRCSVSTFSGRKLESAISQNVDVR